MIDEFGRTAVKLSEGPLGIIALFLVLIYGFASLVLGLAPDIGPWNRTILVLFLVFFPVGVFAVFSWLVSTRHENLYPPGAYRDEQNFYRLASYGKPGFDKMEARSSRPEKPKPPAGTLKATAIGQLFWLGHDLMWSADILLRQGPSEQVLIGLEQALHHLRHVGLENTPAEGQLQTISEMIKGSKDLSPQLRDEYASQIGLVIDHIGSIVEGEQADFTPPPHWQRVRE